MLRTIALLLNPQKAGARALQERTRALLEQAHIRVVCGETGKGQDDDQFPSEALLREVEIAFVLGGDGTLLGVARRLAAMAVPLLGINVGHLGFLTESEPAKIDETVRRVIEREYELEQRLMLEACVVRDGNVICEYVGLNDAGIGKGSFARMVTVDAYVDDVFLDTYSGDGVIVSTPTGSTAYSLSCGGPIVAPHLKVMLITPICPHTLFSRPCVIDDSQQIRLVVRATHEDLGLTVDGQTGIKLQPGDEVLVRKSAHVTTLVKWRDRDFFRVLRQKLHATGQAHGHTGRM